MDGSRTIPRAVYERRVSWLRGLITVLVGVGAGVASHALRAWVNPVMTMGLISGSLVSADALSRALVNRDLRRRGLARPGLIVEDRARSLFGSAAGAAPAEAIEARVSRSTLHFALIAMPLLGLFMAFGAWFCKEDALLFWLCAGMAVFFAVCWVENVLDCGKPLARVDADGVTGYPSHRAVWRRFVAWSDVFGGEFQTFLDVSGKPILLRPILKGRHGETLMKLYLTHAPMAEQERIVEAIKARLPEVEVGPRPE